MSSNVTVEVNGVSKCYFIYANPKYRLLGPIANKLREITGFPEKKYYKEHWALKNINFAIERGDSVGVVGKNGAGKSTLLQMLTGTLSPTSGSIKVNGRVAALLELGAGFNPEFTGQENIYMNASILGLTKEEINARYDEIVSFADIGDFINQPVKTYSSGMYVRLAFAVAANIQPDILIIDEALAVGDIRFQLKCLKHMNALKDNGTTILFVSHSPEQVKRFCNKALWIDGGMIRASGSANDVCDRYNDFMYQIQHADSSNNESRQQKQGTPARIISTKLNTNYLKTGENLLLTIEYQVNDEVVDGLMVGAALYSSERKYLYGINTGLDNYAIANKKGIYTIDYKIPVLPLLPGSFSFDIGIMGDRSLIGFDYITDAEKFTVYNDYEGEGIFCIEHEWFQSPTD
ncbi:ABC transporter ATP-binding protein [Kosakonia sacchari]|uniref:ABC transporter ATP-binding protein n=1 Tax=Kosakonia TaxID=1330547 RepID=UPI00190E28D1|nr:ABC transporter ATP-binding protein [Kosakonia sp. LAM2021]